MGEIEDILTNVALFKNIAKHDISEMLVCTSAVTRDYQKKQVLVLEQTEIDYIGIVLSGQCVASKTDYSGKRLIIAQLTQGSIFGDALSVNTAQKSPVTVTATEPVRALIMPYNAIINRCAKFCPRHDMLLRNLLAILSTKYFDLHGRINCIIRPTLRDKIMTYLQDEASKNQSSTFNVPFDRAALADYLNAERSALSRELAAMKKAGIIDFYKNTFKLI